MVSTHPQKQHVFKHHQNHACTMFLLNTMRTEHTIKRKQQWYNSTMSGKEKKRSSTKNTAGTKVARKRVKDVKHHCRKVTATSHSGFEVLLKGYECHNNIYVAYLEYGGQRLGEAAYTRPINQVYNNTVMKSIGDPTLLYEDDGNDSRDMMSIFPFDFQVDHCETRGIDKAKEAVLNKGWPWNTFVWIRPSYNEILGEQRSKWTLSEWLNHVKVDLEHFMQWTKKHKNVYSAYKYQINIRVNMDIGLHLFSR